MDGAAKELAVEKDQEHKSCLGDLSRAPVEQDEESCQHLQQGGHSADDGQDLKPLLDDEGLEPRQGTHLDVGEKTF